VLWIQFIHAVFGESVQFFLSKISLYVYILGEIFVLNISVYMALTKTQCAYLSIFISASKKQKKGILPSNRNHKFTTQHPFTFQTKHKYNFCSYTTNEATFKETLLALVRDLFTFSSKVIKRFIIV
jgi:hypothetical protein